MFIRCVMTAAFTSSKPPSMAAEREHAGLYRMSASSLWMEGVPIAGDVNANLLRYLGRMHFTVLFAQVPAWIHGVWQVYKARVVHQTQSVEA